MIASANSASRTKGRPMRRAGNGTRALPIAGWGALLGVLLTAMAPCTSQAAAIAQPACTRLPAGVARVAGAGAGTWATAAPMAHARYLHSATLLPGGQVLVAGGQGVACSPSCDLASAELYDSATSAWTPAGSMATARDSHTATLLPSGKVLVAGGETCNPFCSYLASAELYDPATGAWTPTGSMHTARERHTATLLPNGTVLVAGGTNFSSPGLASAELYDPATGIWTPTGSMHAVRYDHTATLLPNGTVLVAGGCCPSTAGAELYDPRTGLWTPTGNLRPARDAHVAALLRTGTVLVAGGESEFCTPQGCGPYGLASAQLYNPATGAWRTTGRLSTVRIGARATFLPGGQVLVVGGLADPANPTSMLASAEAYDPQAGTWSAAGSMAHTRTGHTATLLGNGQVLVTGGEGDCTPFCRILASAELYTP